MQLTEADLADMERMGWTRERMISWKREAQMQQDFERLEERKFHREPASIDDQETNPDTGESFGALVTLSCGHTITVRKLTTKTRFNARHCTECERLSNGG